jgi:hypothetical protein
MAKPNHLFSTHEHMSLMLFVIPGLTRNPVLFWIPAFAGMTLFVVVNDVLG